MVLSALGFNCFGSSANYNHLSQQTTAASVYTSVRGEAAGGGVVEPEGTTSDIEGHMSSCFESLCGRNSEDGD